MSSDGMSLQGNVTEVLRPSQFWEFHNDTVGVVEAPAVQRCYSNTRYCLFYSGSPCCTYGEFYAVGLATATSPYGPFTKWPTNPILGRNQGIAGPGGIGFARPSAVQTYAMYTAWNNLTYDYRGLNMDLMQLNPRQHERACRVHQSQRWQASVPVTTSSRRLERTVGTGIWTQPGLLSWMLGSNSFSSLAEGPKLAPHDHA